MTVADPETRKPCRRQVFLFEQLMIFSEPFERRKDWTVYIYRHSIKVGKVWIRAKWPTRPAALILVSVA